MYRPGIVSVGCCHYFLVIFLQIGLSSKHLKPLFDFNVLFCCKLNKYTRKFVHQRYVLFGLLSARNIEEKKAVHKSYLNSIN